MGVSFYPDDQVELLELIKSADKAMYKVKQEKPNKDEIYLAFTNDMANSKNDNKE
jgi:GGDEF domain-containing protein